MIFKCRFWDTAVAIAHAAKSPILVFRKLMETTRIFSKTFSQHRVAFRSIQGDAYLHDTCCSYVKTCSECTQAIRSCPITKPPIHGTWVKYNSGSKCKSKSCIRCLRHASLGLVILIMLWVLLAKYGKADRVEPCKSDCFHIIEAVLTGNLLQHDNGFVRGNCRCKKIYPVVAKCIFFKAAI